MRNILLKIDIFNLLNCRNITKSVRDKLIFQFDYNKININKKKSRKEKSAKKKSIKDIILVKIMRTSNVFSTNILIFCDSENESKSSILLFFIKSKNIKS
jgi:hypothetical protein